jgi:biopolymer transport protein TolR
MAFTDNNGRTQSSLGEINITPLVDVVLVLLIIFMVTAPLLAQGVKVDLPKAGAEPLPPEAQEPLVLSIDKEGKLYLNVGGSPNASLDEEIVGARVAAALRRAPERPVLVKADTTIAYGRVVAAMVILQHSGAKKVGFVTDALEENKDKKKG